ncbi:MULTISPECIES: glycosyltransferase family 2 protein [Thermus]|uniref:glycosyltransferase family 2 protein n=1 Tax=Thermus TaxID=270 RepID=UPI001F369972|nr:MULTISPECIES: glycosyltransferase [Thermus]
MISVLIPTKGRPGLLLEALGSLLRQTFTAFEALVVEDGEGEGLEAASSLQDPRIRALWNRGRGQVEARLTGLEEVQGEIVLFLDDDDLLLTPTYLHRVWRALGRGEGVAYGEGVLLVGLEVLPFAPGEAGEWLLQDNRILASGTALPRATLLALGSLDPSMGDYWDWDLWLRAHQAGLPFHYLRGPNIGVRVHGQNQSYGKRIEERAFYLARLRAKHGLPPTPLKDHLRLR